MQLQGFIRNTVMRQTPPSRKTGKTYTVYDGELHADDGSKVAISFGFDKPDVREGDYVKFDAFEERGFLQVDKTTIQRLDPPKVLPKAATESAPAPAAAATGNSSSGNFAPQEFNRKTNPEDAKRITFAAASDRAVKVVALLLQHDALPHSKAKGKGGEAQRYQELMAAIDKVAVKLYHDAITLRTLDVVADEGIISTKPSSDLPADPEEKKAASNAALDD